MMVIWLILAIIVVAAVVYGLSRHNSNYKENFADFVKIYVKNLKESRLNSVGVLTAQKVGENNVKITCKIYYREKGKLYEETVEKVFPENKLPAYLLDKLGEEEVDITNDFEQHENFSLSIK